MEETSFYTIAARIRVICSRFVSHRCVLFSKCIFPSVNPRITLYGFAQNGRSYTRTRTEPISSYVRDVPVYVCVRTLSLWVYACTCIYCTHIPELLLAVCRTAFRIVIRRVFPAAPYYYTYEAKLSCSTFIHMYIRFRFILPLSKRPSSSSPSPSPPSRNLSDLTQYRGRGVYIIMNGVFARPTARRGYQMDVIYMYMYIVYILTSAGAFILKLGIIALLLFLLLLHFAHSRWNRYIRSGGGGNFPALPSTCNTRRRREVVACYPAVSVYIPGCRQS